MSEVELTAAQMLRFWYKITHNQTSGCWVWGGKLKRNNGRGRSDPRFSIHKREYSARSLSHRICIGEPVGPISMTCGNPVCVCPAHMKSDGTAGPRKVRIDGTGKRKSFTAAEARRILKLHEAGKSTVEIAERIGVGQPVVCYVVKLGGMCRSGELSGKKK